MFKKIIAWMLLITVTATVAVGGTLAYLTDRDSEANVFTVGDVEIDLTEEFDEENAVLIPGVPIKKVPTIKNVGKNDAWVWAEIAVPTALVKYVEIIGKDETNWMWVTDEDRTEEKINEGTIPYTVITALYNESLSNGDVTTAMFTQVKLAETIDIDPSGNWYNIVEGVANPDEVLWSDDLGNPIIYVSAYGIQTEGITKTTMTFGTEDEITVVDAYFAYYGQWVTVDEVNNGLEWADTVYSSDELRELFTNGGVAWLAEDTVLNGYVKVGEGKDVELDLGGMTVTVESAEDAKNRHTAFVVQKEGTSLVIEGDGVLDMDYTADEADVFCTPVFVSSSATAIIEGGTYYMGQCQNKYHMYCQNSGTLIINDGTFITSNPNAALAYCINGFIEINGGFFQNTADPNQALLSMGNNIKYVDNQKITLRGGTFVNWNPMSSAFAQAWPESGVPALIVLADGYEVVAETQDNGDIWYTVMSSEDANAEVVVNGVRYQTLEEALDKANGGTIKLLKDVELSAAVEVADEVSMNLNGKTLSTVGLDLQNGGYIQNGTIVSADNTSMVPHLKISGGELTMDNVTVDIDHYVNAKSYWSEATGIEINGATVTMNNCNISIHNSYTAKWVYSYAITVQNGAVITVNGGSVTSTCVNGTASNGPTNPNAICSVGNCTATMNNVSVTAKYYACTVNGCLTINTTDDSITNIVDHKGGSHVVNYID